MRKLLLAFVLVASTMNIQTTAFAQTGPEEGSRAYCEAKWGRVVAAGATHGENEGAFIDKCMSCQAKWDEMVAAHTTGGMDRGDFMKDCSKAVWWVGTPELLLLGAAGAGIGIGLSGGHGGHQPPVSP